MRMQIISKLANLEITKGEVNELRPNNDCLN